MQINLTPRKSTVRRVAGASLLVTLAGGAAFVPATGAHAAVNTNSVVYWCGSDDAGIKYEPVTDPFVVPASPDGLEWTFAVVKAGSGPDENFVVQVPAAGDALSFPGDAPANSHVILCWAPVVDDPPPVIEETPPADEPPADEPPTDEAPPVDETPVVVEQWTPPPPPAVDEPVASASQALVELPTVEAPAAAATTQLPQTGTSTGVLAAAATVLVALGVGLRRVVVRKV